MTQLINPNTGLPEVPEGQFWKVVPAVTTGYFRIQLRQKSFLGLSQTLGWTVVESPLSDEKLRRMAFSILDRIENERLGRLRSQADAQYIGSYPPKKLKGTNE